MKNLTEYIKESQVNEAKDVFAWLPDYESYMPKGVSAGKIGDYYVVAAEGNGGYVVYMNDSNTHNDKVFYVTTLEHIDKQIAFTLKKPRQKRRDVLGPDGEMHVSYDTIDPVPTKQVAKERIEDSAECDKIKKSAKVPGYTLGRLAFYAEKGKKKYSYEKIKDEFFYDFKDIENASGKIIFNDGRKEQIGRLADVTPMVCKDSTLALVFNSKCVGDEHDYQRILNKHGEDMKEYLSSFRGQKFDKFICFYGNSMYDYEYDEGTVYTLIYDGITEDGDIKFSLDKHAKVNPEPGAFEHLVAGEYFKG